MILQRQTSQNCMIFAVAMAMDLPADEVIRGVGHDGTAPYKTLAHRGVHMQEVQTYVLGLGHHFYPIIPYPSIEYAGVERIIYEEADAAERLLRLIEGKTGVIEGLNHNKMGHVVAFECKDGVITIYDPAGRVVNLLDTTFAIQTVWVYV